MPNRAARPAAVESLDNMPRGYLGGGGLVPIPDPSKLTTDQLRQEVKNLRELIEARLEGVTGTMQSNRELLANEIDKLGAVSSERFTRIDTQFIERDKRTDQLSLADKTAVAAALQAAKEAVGAQNTSNSIAIAKSESSTVESIKQLQTLFNSAIDGLNDKVNDVKSRLDRGEGGHTASKEVHGDNRANVGIVISAAVASVVVLSALAGLITFIVSRAH